LFNRISKAVSYPQVLTKEPKRPPCKYCDGRKLRAEPQVLELLSSRTGVQCPQATNLVGPAKECKEGSCVHKLSRDYAVKRNELKSITTRPRAPPTCTVCGLLGHNKKQRVCPKHPSNLTTPEAGAEGVEKGEVDYEDSESKSGEVINEDESETVAEEGEHVSLNGLDLAEPAVDLEDLPLSTLVDRTQTLFRHHMKPSKNQETLKVVELGGQDQVRLGEKETVPKQGFLAEEDLRCHTVEAEASPHLNIEPAFILAPQDPQHPPSMKSGGRIRLRAVELAGEATLMGSRELEGAALHGSAQRTVGTDDGEDVPIGQMLKKGRKKTKAKA
jgi:hypothetical protein